MVIPNNSMANTAVNMSSKALANVFSIEFNDRKNSDVVIPTAALLNTMRRVSGDVKTFPNSWKKEARLQEDGF